MGGGIDLLCVFSLSVLARIYIGKKYIQVKKFTDITDNEAANSAAARYFKCEVDSLSPSHSVAAAR